WQTAARPYRAHSPPISSHLLVPKTSKIKSASELWARDRIDDTLISLPTNESMYKRFQRGLARLGVDWFTGIEVSTVELVQNICGQRLRHRSIDLSPESRNPRRSACFAARRIRAGEFRAALARQARCSRASFHRHCSASPGR